ncbi:DUF5410 family protein [Candidatus Tisiphia endosymbiont of Nemotelus uliginosus]|uniref:DUF5410 family protein n=1 Tax=Candidatus Tisiphia endosymbiont of Nemotelus uliginosus TaxID=3077926 RepID=UPI0035C92125
MPILSNSNLQLIKNIIQQQIIRKLFTGDITDHDINAFLTLYNYPVVNQKLKECLTQITQKLEAGTLHKINAAIIRHSNSIVSEEDDCFMLRTPKESLLLLLLRKEGELFGMTWLFDQEGNFVVPKIPAAILDHYATLNECFYPGRQSKDSLDTRIAKSISWIFYNNVEMLEKNSQVVKDSFEKAAKFIEILNDFRNPNGHHVLNLVENNVSASCQHIELNDESRLSNRKINEYTDNMTKILIPVLVQDIIDHGIEAVKVNNILLDLKTKVFKSIEVKPTLTVVLSDQLEAAYTPELLEILLQQKGQIIKLIENNLRSSKVKDSKVVKISEDITTLILKYLYEQHCKDLTEITSKRKEVLEDNITPHNSYLSSSLSPKDNVFSDGNIASHDLPQGEHYLTCLMGLGY